ncbi:MAG: MFS transporter [Gaiellales bacterium]
MLEPLRQRRFRLLFLAQCASFLGDSIFIIALAFAVLQVTGSARDLSLVLGIGTGLLVLSFLVSGVWADRLPRLPLMIASDVVRLASQGTLAVLLITDTATLGWLIMLNGVYSMATAFFQPARTGITPQLLDVRMLIPGNGLMAMAENVVWMIGWAVGGLLVAWVGVGWAIAIDAATFLVSALFLLAIGRVPRAVRSEERTSFLYELRDGFREVTSRRWLWFVVINSTLFLMVYEAPMQILGPLTMKADYNGASTWGFALSAMAGGAMLGAIVSASNRLPRPMLVALCLFFASAAVPVLLLVAAPLWAIMLCNALAGFGFGLFDTVWRSAIQHGVPADKVARVSAWDWMGSLAGMPIGFALAGVLVEWIGRDATLGVMAAATLLVSIALIADRETRHLGDDLRNLGNSSPTDEFDALVPGLTDL